MGPCADRCRHGVTVVVHFCSFLAGNKKGPAPSPEGAFSDYRVQEFYFPFIPPSPSSTRHIPLMPPATFAAATLMVAVLATKRDMRKLDSNLWSSQIYVDVLAGVNRSIVDAGEYPECVSSKSVI